MYFIYQDKIYSCASIPCCRTQCFSLAISVDIFNSFLVDCIGHVCLLRYWLLKINSTWEIFTGVQNVWNRLSLLYLLLLEKCLSKRRRLPLLQSACAHAISAGKRPTYSISLCLQESISPISTFIHSAFSVLFTEPIFKAKPIMLIKDRKLY